MIRFATLSLRARLLGAIFAALWISFSLTTMVAVWQAARAVHVELAAALLNARQSTLAALSDLPAGAQGQAQLQRIVTAFNDSRHVRAALIGMSGSVVMFSEPTAAPAPPVWFLRLVAPSLKSVALPVGFVPGYTTLRLTVDPRSETAERWTELRLRLASFAVFFAVAALLCSLTVARSLRPLTSLAQALARVGRGESQPALPQAGPPEIAALGRAFNAMAAALHAADGQNRRLSHQIRTIAEEERAQIARDLHDEIGPLLFAITAFTAAIGRLVETGNLAEVPAQLQAIQDATAQLQRQVRDMLAQLHQADAPPADLRAALHALIAFWRSVRPETDFASELPAALDLPEAMRDCVYRSAQEAISNAVRHGKPGHVALTVQNRHDRLVLTVHDDGVGGPEGPGLGLPGMRARAAALGGSVHLAMGRGWTVTVGLPMSTA